MARDHKTIPILITWDVDPDAWLPPEKRHFALTTALNLCAEHNIPATFFFTAKLAETYTERFAQMQAEGHEVGCHGWTHGIEENYDQMDTTLQRDYIAQATAKMRALAGEQVCAFRSPRVKISAATLRLLSEHGYTTDSSVCSQRIDFISSNLINLGWLFAPRRPYHPQSDHAFKKGTLPLWEVPVSALVLPFISSTLRVTGPKWMCTLARLLYLEARRTGKPIVYLAHPTEFLGSGKKRSLRTNFKQFLNPKYFTPAYIRAHGFRFRNLFYAASGPVLQTYTRSLFSYLAALPDVEFLTMRDYRARYLEPPSESAGNR